jgi:hypothetical protein
MDHQEAKLREHWATRAWLTLHPCETTPQRVEELKPEHQKSAVYRLVGAGPEGTAIVAKRCALPTVAVERAVYEDILPHVPYPTLQFFGTLEEPGEDLGWLFVEDAGGVPYSTANSHHRILAAEWLAVLHTSAEGLRGTISLPDRGLGYHRENLRSTYAVLAAGAANPALDPTGLALIEAIRSHCRILEARWEVIQELWKAMPNTIVHGGFYRKNVHIGNRGGRPVVHAFDWESAGWGVPVLDLVHEDLDEYWSRIGAHWPNLTREVLERSTAVGAMLWGVKAIIGEESTLRSPWANRLVGKLEHYSRDMKASIDRLEWQP